MAPNGGGNNEPSGNRRIFDNFFNIGRGSEHSVSYRDVRQDDSTEQSGRRRRRSSHSPTSPTSPSARIRIDPTDPEPDTEPDTQPPTQPVQVTEHDSHEAPHEAPLTSGQIRSIMREGMEEFMPRITSIEQRITDQQFQNDLVRDEINTLEEANNELGESHAALQDEVAGIQRAAREQQLGTDNRFANVNEVILELTRRIDLLEEQINENQTTPTTPPTPTTLSEHEIRAVRTNIQQAEDNYFLSTILINARQILMLVGCEDIVADCDRTHFFNQHRSLRITYDSPRKMHTTYQSMVSSCIQIRRNGSTPGLRFSKMIPYRCKEQKAAFT